MFNFNESQTNLISINDTAYLTSQLEGTSTNYFIYSSGQKLRNGTTKNIQMIFIF